MYQRKCGFTIGKGSCEARRLQIYLQAVAGGRQTHSGETDVRILLNYAYMLTGVIVEELR